MMQWPSLSGYWLHTISEPQLCQHVSASAAAACVSCAGLVVPMVSLVVARLGAVHMEKSWSVMKTTFLSAYQRTSVSRTAIFIFFPILFMRRSAHRGRRCTGNLHLSTAPRICRVARSRENARCLIAARCLLRGSASRMQSFESSRMRTPFQSLASNLPKCVCCCFDGNEICEGARSPSRMIIGRPQRSRPCGETCAKGRVHDKVSS